VELVGDGRCLRAAAEHPDAAGDVAAQVGDQRDEVVAGVDVGPPASSRRQAGRGDGVSDHDEEVHEVDAID
jgi:hypothetical protein